MAANLTDVTREINSPIGQVWAIVTSFGAEVLWFPKYPRVKASSLEGYGIGSVRTIYFEKTDWVGIVKEEMTICEPAKHHIQWKVFNDNVPEDIFSNIILDDIDGKSTRLRWYAEGPAFPEADISASMRKFFEALYNNCVDTLIEKIGHV